METPPFQTKIPSISTLPISPFLPSISTVYSLNIFIFIYTAVINNSFFICIIFVVVYCVSSAVCPGT
jgi:hypothetical protein